MLALNSQAFEQIKTLPHGSTVALIIFLTASLSQVVQESVILFVNRVKPVRFVFSLLIGAVVFAFGYIFLVLSTWLISFAPFTVKAPFGVVAYTLGFSYAPLIFSIFGAMPYLGEPLLSLLSLWHLLAMVIGLAAITKTGVWQAFGTVQLRNAAWREGQRALLIHVYGGIGGKKTEPKAKSPLYFGRFAYGIVQVVREELTDELRFEIVYHQIYTHNTDGLIAGSLHWSRYMGDRSFGWRGK